MSSQKGSYQTGVSGGGAPRFQVARRSRAWLLQLLKLRPGGRKLRSTFRSRWGRWWWLHPRAKQAGIFSATILVVVIGVFTFQLWYAAGRIIDGGNSAVALGENVDPNLLNKEGDGRINLLLIGVGGGNHQGGDLSDSIMVASLDPVTKSLSMVSFPRDLYVPIEGYGSAKINAAHAYGEQYGYPGGGPKLLADTITHIFDIPIHYYLRVDFQGFKKALDAVGGVDVTVKKAINDFTYPNQDLSGYEPFRLSAGQQHLDSETALRYVRSRYDSSDFDRADRQQQLLLALKDKALSAATFLDPIKVNRLVSIAAGHMRTSLTVEDGLKLMNLAGQVDSSQVSKANLDSSEGNLLVSRIIDGSWVLTPASGDFSTINQYLRGIMPDGYIKRESAAVKIINHSHQAGAGKAVAQLLKTYGYQVIAVDNSQVGLTSLTEMIDYSGNSKPYTTNYLKKRFKTGVRLADRTSEQLEDITIILGSDYAATSN